MAATCYICCKVHNKHNGCCEIKNQNYWYHLWEFTPLYKKMPNIAVFGQCEYMFGQCVYKSLTLVLLFDQLRKLFVIKVCFTDGFHILNFIPS